MTRVTVVLATFMSLAPALSSPTDDRHKRYVFAFVIVALGFAMSLLAVR